MTTNKRVFLGLDIGGRRIGLAVGDSIARLSQPLGTVVVDGHETATIKRHMEELDITDLVIGRPRNQSGETTAQTTEVERYIKTHMSDWSQPVHWQDESVTSVIAEERLKKRQKNYNKADIDSEAAAIILQDYLEDL